MAWHYGFFTVRLMDGREVKTRGMVSPPFGTFQGTSHGPDKSHLRTLIHLPTSRVIATLKGTRQCRTLAAEIAPVLLRGELPDLLPVIDRHIREAK